MIPKQLWQIWVGPNPAPLKWMNTWKEHHPDWKYTLVDNAELAKHDFHNQHLIDHYLHHQPQQASYAGAADLIKYELLYRYGGFIPEADSTCLHPTDELWSSDEDCCYTVYENEKIKPGYVSPIFASNRLNEFLEIIITDLHKLTPNDLRKRAVYMTTGNEYLARMVEIHKPNIKIFPSHYFIPVHYTNLKKRYRGPDKVYCDQYWGSTHNNYHKGVL